MEQSYYDFNLRTGEKLRCFSEGIEKTQLVWHRDKEDRVVEVVDGIDWQFQFDNEKPRILTIGEEFHIPKMTYHRLIKGKSTLVLRIKEV